MGGGGEENEHLSYALFGVSFFSCLRGGVDLDGDAMSQSYIRANDDEYEQARPTPRPSPTRAYLHADKVRIMSQLLEAWSLCPTMRLGQLLYVAAIAGDEHLTQISDEGLATAVRIWSEQYK